MLMVQGILEREEEKNRRKILAEILLQSGICLNGACKRLQKI
jgi:hypothetical protein